MAGRQRDGGPAFPASGAYDQDGVCLDRGQTGMSLRDWLAGQALAGLLADPDVVGSTAKIATGAVEFADALLIALQENPHVQSPQPGELPAEYGSEEGDPD